MPWFKVAESTVVAQPFLLKVNARGKTICLINADGQLYALSATCPHAGADLSKGWCESGKLICPFHRYAYDMETGKGAPGQNDFIRTYPVKVKADGIYVEVAGWMESVKKIFR